MIRIAVIGGVQGNVRGDTIVQNPDRTRQINTDPRISEPLIDSDGLSAGSSTTSSVILHFHC